MIFAAALVLAVSAHLFWLTTFVSSTDCEAPAIIFFGAPGTGGLFDTLFQAGLVLATMQGAVLIHGVLSGRYRWPDIVFGGVNFGLIGAILAYCIINAAFFHPHAAGAAFVNGLNRQVGNLQFYEFGRVRRPALDPELGWEQVSATRWRNPRIGIEMRYETYQTCWTEDFARANFEARYPDRAFSAPGYVNRADWFYYDFEGRRIEHTGDTRPMPALPEAETSPITDDELGDLFQSLRDLTRPTLPEGTPLLTYREILAVVEEENAAMQERPD